MTTDPMTSPSPVLVVDEVGHVLGGSARVLQDVSVQLAAGEVLALVGRSGSGKTTLCHLVAGLGRPTSGRITGGAARTRTTSTTGRSSPCCRNGSGSSRS